MISKSKKNNKYDKKHTVKKNIIQKQKSLKNIKNNKNLKKYKYKHGGASNSFKVKYYYGTNQQKNLWKQYEELASKDLTTIDEEQQLEILKKKYNDFEESIKYTFGTDEEKKQWRRLKELSDKNDRYKYGKSYEIDNPEKNKIVHNVSEKLTDDEEQELDDLEDKFADAEEIILKKLNEERLIEEKLNKEKLDEEKNSKKNIDILSQNSTKTLKISSITDNLSKLYLSPTPKSILKKSVTLNTNIKKYTNVQDNTQEDLEYIAQINKNINKSEESTNFKNTVNGIVKYLMNYKFNKNDIKRNKFLQKDQVNLLMYYFNLIFNKDFNRASRLHRYERLKMLISSIDKDQPQLSNTLKEKYLELIEQYKDINSNFNENEKESEIESEIESENDSENKNEIETESESDNDNEDENENENKTTSQITNQLQQNFIKNEKTSSISNKSIIGLLSSISIIAIVLGVSMK